MNVRVICPYGCVHRQKYLWNGCTDFLCSKFYRIVQTWAHKWAGGCCFTECHVFHWHHTYFTLVEHIGFNLYMSVFSSTADMQWSLSDTKLSVIRPSITCFSCDQAALIGPACRSVCLSVCLCPSVRPSEGSKNISAWFSRFISDSITWDMLLENDGNFGEVINGTDIRPDSMHLS